MQAILVTAAKAQFRVASQTMRRVTQGADVWSRWERVAERVVM